jgi:hypothetical protein
MRGVVGNTTGAVVPGEARLPSGCPVCDQPVPSAATFCSSCGYPTALALDALRALSDGDPTPVTPGAGRPSAPAKRRPARSATPDAQEEQCARVAQETDTHLGILQELGGDTLDVATDLRQAALAQADGRVVEALDILRRGLGRVQDQAQALFDRRVKELEDRDAVLKRSGVNSNIRSDTHAMREMFAGGRRIEAIALMKSTHQFLSRIEGDWKGLQGLLRQIETLREAVRETGQEPPEVEEDIRSVRGALSGPGVSIEGLDAASQTAARAVMLLNEALPVAITEELEAHDATLARFGADPDTTRVARNLHTEAIRHLRRGRLPEASASLRQLRAAIRSLKTLPPPEEPGPAPAELLTVGGAEERVAPEAPRPPPPAAEGTSEFLNRLLTKARELAARVRTLPPESEIAFEAAAEIRLATELLRGRKLDEAEATLTRLMRTLDAESPLGA